MDQRLGGVLLPGHVEGSGEVTHSQPTWSSDPVETENGK
jgi:hypothetical protein